MKRHGFPNPWRGGGCGRTMKRFDDPAAPQKDKTFLVAHVIAALDDSMRKTMELCNRNIYLMGVYLLSAHTRCSSQEKRSDFIEQAGEICGPSLLPAL